MIRKLNLVFPTEQSRINLKFDSESVPDKFQFDPLRFNTPVFYDQRLEIKIIESQYTHVSLKFVYLVDIISQVGGFNAALWLFFVVIYRSWFTNMFLVKIGDKLSEGKPLKDGQTREQQREETI